MNTERRQLVQESVLRRICLCSALLLFGAAFCFASPRELVVGMKAIILSRDALITDYFELAGYGAGFLNAGLMLLVSIVLVEHVKIPYTGLTLAALFISTGFGFWGKNPINSLPIIFGTWIYSKLQGVAFSRYVYTSLFATCLAPFVTELVYILPFPRAVNIVIAAAAGIFIGFMIPPLSAHTSSMHMGYSLFNVGFSGGTLAFVLFCVLKSHGIESESVFIWKAERHLMIVTGIFLYFFAIFLIGLWMEQWDIRCIRRVMRHPGRAVADFVLMDGPGVTLLNMGLMGMFSELHILLAGGDMSGPILGCLLTVFGFSAFGAHLRNYIPVMLGVYLSTICTKYSPDTPSILIASLFCVGICPIAGQFGTFAGIIAGILHSAIVMCTGQMYGGLNLYNNGFSAGWVAIVMVPFIESFMKRYETRKIHKTVPNEKKQRRGML